MTITLKDGSTTEDHRLDRLIEFDEKSREYPVHRLLSASQLQKPRTYTWGIDITLDQGREGACTGFATSHELAARPYQVRGVSNEFALQVYFQAQRIDPWPGGCVDVLTECLTSRGWIGVGDIQPGDTLLGFDKDSRTLKWANVDDVHVYNDAPYRVYTNKGFEAAVTDNHKWAVRNRVNPDKPYEMVRTDEWLSKHEFPRAALADEFPSEAKWSDDFVELVAWVSTEGGYRDNPAQRNPNGVTVWQKVEFDRLNALMSRFGIQHSPSAPNECYSWVFSGDLGKQVKEVAPGRAPTFDWLRSLTKAQLELFVEVSLLGDGSTDEPIGNRVGRDTYWQNSGPILDSFLFACTLLGKPVSRKTPIGSRVNKTTGKENEGWSVRRSSGFVQPRKLKSSGYLYGKVWCPQSELGTFVARRGKSVFITGNSYPGASPRYDGTSVLSAIKTAQDMGYYTGYSWAFSEEELMLAISWKGPAVLGINWYESMYSTDSKFMIRPTGAIAGGHAILCNGFSEKDQVYRLHNSWSASYGKNGDCFITREDMKTWLAADGEVCIPSGRSLGK